jgi:hypothetical protein
MSPQMSLQRSSGWIASRLILCIGTTVLVALGCGVPSSSDVQNSELSTAVPSTSGVAAAGCPGTTSSSTTGSNGGSTTSGGHGTTTGGSGTGGTGTTGGQAGTGEAWIWVFTDYANGLAALKQKTASFTHVSPALYHLNYAYTSGVPSFTSGPSDGCSSTATFVDNFNGLTSTQIAQKIHAMGMKVVPLIYGGAANCGTDKGIQNVLNDSPAGTQKAFIDALVAEAETKGYDGWNLDWETFLSDNPYAPLLTSFLGAAHKAFAAKGLTLSIDIIGSNVKQSWCSGGSGYVDLDKIGPVVDGVVIESYQSSIGSNLTACPTNLPNPLACNYPSAAACPAGECMGSDLALICAHLPLGKAIIGLDSIGRASNPIAGKAVTTIEDYGFKRMAVWPDWNNDGPNGTYQFLDTKGIVPATTNWYTLTQDFLEHWGG